VVPRAVLADHHDRATMMVRPPISAAVPDHRRCGVMLVGAATRAVVLLSVVLLSVVLLAVLVVVVLLAPMGLAVTPAMPVVIGNRRGGGNEEQGAERQREFVRHFPILPKQPLAMV